MLSVKQGGIKYHSKSIWYDLTWDWTQVSRAIGEHSNHNNTHEINENHFYKFIDTHETIDKIWY